MLSRTLQRGSTAKYHLSGPSPQICSIPARFSLVQHLNMTDNSLAHIVHPLLHSRSTTTPDRKTDIKHESVVVTKCNYTYMGSALSLFPVTTSLRSCVD